MPALTANSVTLSEILEVRASPLSEQELWAVLSESSDALQDVFLDGQARQRGLTTYTITPGYLLLCHNGQVKFTLHTVSKNHSFTPPEIYSKQKKANERALEKICIYSLGMTLYHAAEYEIPVGKPINLSETLESVLLSMCEESSQLRISLTQVLEVCHGHSGRRHFKDQISLMVAAVLGENMPDNDDADFNLVDETVENMPDNDDDFDLVDETVDIGRSEFMNGQSPSISPELVSPRSLPSPPSSRMSTQGQPTAEELVGSNHRRSGSPTALNFSPQHPRKNHIPHVLEKYKDHLEHVRRGRSQAISPSKLSSNMSSTDQSHPNTGHQSQASSSNQSRSSSSATQLNGTLENRLPHTIEGSSKSLGSYRPGSRRDEGPETGYFEVPVEYAGINSLRRYGSETSITDSMSVVSGPQLSDGRSSMISITQGSYVPESYLTDGYDSEPYFTSIGSSASQAAFQRGKAPDKSNGRQYSSTVDLRRPVMKKVSVSSLPPANIDEVDYQSHYMPQRFFSVPDIHISSDAPEGRNGSKAKLRTFFGPEFVQVAEDPNLSVVSISPRTAGYLPRGRRMVTVVMLNGQKLQIMVETTTTTQVLFDQVIKYLGVSEKIFFGLSQLQDGEHVFLDLDVKLAKYAPPKWKEEAKVPSEPFLLNFRVKFYVENVALLSHQKTRHQFYLQLRRDVLESQLYCHEDALFILGGLALQAETGDYYESLGDQYFLPEHYVTKRVIDRVSVDQACQELPRAHKMFAGLTDEQAELKFIQEAQNLQEYGVHFYKVYTSKKRNKECIWLGICVRGVTVYEARGHIKYPVHRHSWPLTKKLSFKKKKFFIEPRDTPDPPKLMFYTNHYKKSRYLLQLCQAFHRFQMKMRTRLAAIDQETPDDKPRRKAGNGPAAVVQNPMPYNRNRNHGVEPTLSDNQRQPSVEHKQDLPDWLSINTNTDSRHYSASDESEDSTSYYRQELLKHVSHNVDDEKDGDVPYVIDSTLNSQTPGLAKSRELASEAQNGGNLEVLPSPDREIRVIKFKKEPEKGLGITVLGGENSKRLDLGIFVKSVAKEGAAGKDGRLKAGDRILAVNGQSLERVTHEQAVSILKNATSPVELVLSQSSYNVSSFDLSSIPSASSTSDKPVSLSSEETPSSPVKSHSGPLRESSPEPRPSKFAFPSEDEPVTMVSKSIPPYVPPALNEPSRGVQHSPHNSKDSSSFESEDSGVVKSPSPAPAPVEINVIQSSLLSAAAPAVSASLMNRQLESSGAGQEPGPQREEPSYEEDLPEKAFVVDLEKKDGGLGLSVTGGVNTSVKLGGIYVKSLQLNGPADLDGRIQIGDRILAVNGISLVGVTHKQAVETIKIAPQASRLVLDRSVPVVIPKMPERKAKSQAFDKPFSLELVKGVGGLGLSLVGGEGAGEEHGGYLRIKKMFPGQPAAASGKLQIGDIVLAVNETDMKGVTHQEAVNLIRVGPSKVKLLVKREPSSIPSSLLRRAGSNASDVDPAQILADIQTKLQTENSPSLGKRSCDTSVKESLSSRSESLDLQHEPSAQQQSEPPVSLKSSLLPGELKMPRIKSPVECREDQAAQEKPGFCNRLSEPVMQVKREQPRLAQTNSLPNVISVRPIDKQLTDSSATYEESEDASTMSGNAPLAEDESSDVEDSRRSSSIDMIPPDRSVHDERGMNELMGRLSTVESTQDSEGVDGERETGHPLTVNSENMVSDEAMPSPPSSESEKSDGEVELVDVTNGDELQTESELQEDKLAPTSITPQEQILEIELVKGPGGLGFTLAGGADTMGGCFVRDIVGGPAKEDGRLQKGDQIMMVDGVNIMSMKHLDAVDVLRATKQRVKLVVLRRPSGVVGDTKSGPVEVINLTRTSHGRIGLLIKEGEDGDIYVEDVVPGEPAATQGSLRQGDKILEINGVKVNGVGFVAARQHLDAARPVARLLVTRRPRIAESKYTMAQQTDSGVLSPSPSLDVSEHSADSSDDHDEPSGQAMNEQEEEEDPMDEQFTLKLEKGPRGFGFSLVAAPTISSDSQGIFIKTISPGSVAESDGRLAVGDQILMVNGEDVQGLSHARVIGMLRKITGEVELEIKRPAKLHLPSSITDSPKLTKASSKLVPPARAPLERVPHSVDLDITLEDKDRTLTGSSDIQDEDDVAELLNAISLENNRSSPPTPPKNSVRSRPPRLQKRDTDTVLTSLLESMEPPPSPPDSLPSVDPREFDSQWESGYSDSDAPPDLVPNRTRASRWSGSDSSSPRSEKGFGKTLGGRKHQNRSFESNISTHASDDDEDVFDMLKDNSQVVIDMLHTKEVQSNSDHTSTGRHKTLSKGLNIPPEIPPPIPTTPIPSDDDEPPVKPPPRRESLPKSPQSELREDMVNGLVSAHGSNKEAPEVSEPLIDVVEGGSYTGQQLNALIQNLQEKISTHLPAQEFKALREMMPTDGCSTGKQLANKDKNRYRNVLPYEKTRVKLSGGGDHSNYINANHVRVQVGQDVYNYIATQGPLPNTTHDFWQMVWEQEVDVISMVTLEREGGKVKCHRYWPESENQPLVFAGSLKVNLQKQEDFGSFIERELSITNLQNGEQRTVFQINFTKWPDHGVPKSAVELVEFVRFMRLLADGPGPIVVHCSAGIGRTGALITIDVAIGLMERDLPFDVNKIIRNLREQRQGMIQTKDQYIFCYKACLDVLLSLTVT